jgi:hypothetical protein
MLENSYDRSLPWDAAPAGTALDGKKPPRAAFVREPNVPSRIKVPEFLQAFAALQQTLNTFRE